MSTRWRGKTAGPPKNSRGRRLATTPGVRRRGDPMWSPRASEFAFPCSRDRNGAGTWACPYVELECRPHRRGSVANGSSSRGDPALGNCQRQLATTRQSGGMFQGRGGVTGGLATNARGSHLQGRLTYVVGATPCGRPGHPSSRSRADIATGQARGPAPTSGGNADRIAEATPSRPGDVVARLCGDAAVLPARNDYSGRS